MVEDWERIRGSNWIGPDNKDEEGGVGSEDRGGGFGGRFAGFGSAMLGRSGTGLRSEEEEAI